MFQVLQNTNGYLSEANSHVWEFRYTLQGVPTGPWATSVNVTSLNSIPDDFCDPCIAIRHRGPARTVIPNSYIILQALSSLDQYDCAKRYLCELKATPGNSLYDYKAFNVHWLIP